MRPGLATIALLMCWAGCLSPAGAADDQSSQQILWPTKAWPVSTPEAQGMDSASVARLIEAVGGTRQDSLMIIRHGNIVAEAYYAPYVAGISHDLRSVTKSIVSTLTAIELQHGLLDSVDHPVLDLFADKNIANVDDNKRALTVQNLLDMDSGIEWKERAYTPVVVASRKGSLHGARPPFATDPGASKAGYRRRHDRRVAG
jgi:CubicO group peptidase (beta-lactamase class C family)